MQDEAPSYVGISKTQRKKDMLALQVLGTQLVELNESQLAEMHLPESLLEAVLEARRIGSREGRRRQMQFIGKLMREIDAAPIREKLETWRGQSDGHTAQLHRIERWRDELIAGDPALEQFLRDYPGADSQALRTLIRNARRERDSAQPPKSFRELFRVLRETVAAGGGTDKIDP